MGPNKILAVFGGRCFAVPPRACALSVGCGRHCRHSSGCAEKCWVGESGRPL